MKIKYESTDKVSFREEEITKAHFFTHTTTDKVYVTCQRARSNPFYDNEDKFNNKFEIAASEILWIR